MRSAASSKCPKNLHSRAVAPHNVQLRIIGSADKDPVAWRVVAGPVGLRNDADAFGLDAEGDDLALELVAGLLEGTDGCHFVSPWLFEPATIAASMAIDRLQAIDDAPLGAGAQRRMATERPPPSRGHPFLAREEWAQPRVRKSRRRRCGKAIEACRPVARSRHQEAARVARQTALQGEDVADMGPCKRRGSTGEGMETLAYGKVVPAI